jgi:predicted phage-related endonuclease
MTMIQLNVQQGTREWLNARAKCFNASEAPAMMGVSAYMTRSELLRQKATGIAPEPDAATLGRFNAGHEAEANARPLVEAIIGEPLYPIVATDDDGRLLASSDGATMLCDIGFEHKLWNAEVAAKVSAGEVPDSHKWQLDQQIAVFGFEKIIFVCSDGTPQNFVHCEYRTTPERIAQLKAGWDQFEIDLKNYQPEQVKPAIVADAIDDLPALTVQLVGQVTASNLETFEAAIKTRIKAISTDLKTDADFVNADKMVKFLDDGEKKLDLVKSQALAQTASIDQLFRTIDSLKAEMKSKRLALDKLVKAEKENRKADIVREAQIAFDSHHSALVERVGISFSVAYVAFAEAIKGLKSLDSMRDKVSVALANAKVEANAIADRIEANRKTIDDMSLFPDFAQVCMKPADDFGALLSVRIAQRREAEEKRLEAERQRIRAEEEAKARAKAAAEQAEANRLAAEAQAKAQQAERERATEELAAAKQSPDGAELSPAAQSLYAQEGATRFAEHHRGAIASESTGQTMNLGQINAALGFTVTADFLAGLGITPVRQEKSAKLYDANKLPTTCRLIQEHLNKVMQKAFGGIAA